MPISDKMNKLEEITRDEQEKGAARLDQLGLHNIGDTIQDVMENIPTEGGGSGFNVQANWAQDDSEAPDYIKNKPEIPPKIQFTEFPAATSVPRGTIYQYVGSGDNAGAFFIADKLTPGDPPNFRVWKRLQVDDLDKKQDNIIFTPQYVLTAAGWDSETKRQTISFISQRIEMQFKTTFDMGPANAAEWAAAGVHSHEIWVYQDGVANKSYLDSIEFECDSIPTGDIYFFLTSYKTKNDVGGLFFPYFPGTDVSSKQNIVLTTPLTIGGVSKTTVEEALAALNSVKLEDVDSTPTSGSNNPVSSDGVYQALQNAGGSADIGDIKMTACSTAPDGWMICDGSAISRTTYADLFAAIGTTYGTGDGSTTFNIPNLAGKTALGANSSHSLGSTGGAETQTITANNLPKHTHPMGSIQMHVQSSSSQSPSGNYISTSSGRYSLDTWSQTGNTGQNSSSATALNIMSPYCTINYIIYTGVN